MKPRFFYLGLFLLTCLTLMLEIIQTRLLSVMCWYHLAFFVVSAAMFGMTGGAVWIYLRGGSCEPGDLSRSLRYYSLAFAPATAICVALEVLLDPVLVLSVSGVMIFALLSVLVGIPFFFSGAAVSLALTRSPFPISRVYAVDLLGAAAGCLGVLAVLNSMDAVSAILLTAAGGALAAWFFEKAGQASPSSDGRRSLVRNPLLVCLLLTGLAIANGWTSRGIQPLFAKGHVQEPGDSYRREWNTFSRIAVSLIAKQRPPSLWAASKTLPPDTRVDRVLMTVDAEAGTAMYRVRNGDLSDAAFLRYDVTNLAYFIRHSGRAAVVGVGGGRDVLSAKVFGFPEVTGVELNPVFINLLTQDPKLKEFAGLADMPGVRLITHEGRSWFARSREQFDLIQMSMIDTWAATGAGAFSLSENGLYTVEAWSVFLRRLTDHGVFTVSRWFSPDYLNETGRMMSLATATLIEAGAARPREHMFLAANGNVATLIVSRSPLNAEDLGTLRRTCEQMQYDVLVSPNEPVGDDLLGRIVSAQDRASLRAVTQGLSLNLTPPTDNEPFFFNILPFGNPLQMYRIWRQPRTHGVVDGNMTATMTMLVILAVSVLLVLATIIVPLYSKFRSASPALALSGTLYFGLLGVGFMFVEIGLLQRLSVYLGHPIYSLSIVLFSVILATGIGSHLSGRVPLSSSRRRIVWSVLLAGYIISLPYWMPAMISATDHASIPVKGILSVLAIAPAGLLMGFGFPTGMNLVGRVSADPTPWFWGINGAAGVLGSVLAVMTSIAFGISTTLLIGAVCYLALIPAAAIVPRGAETKAEHPEAVAAVPE